MSIKATHELKALQGRRTQAEAELEVARAEVKEAQRKESAIRNRLGSIKDQIEKLTATPKEVIVTEHALLRYIERSFGIDLQEIRERMLSPEVRGLIDQFGSGKFPSENVRLIVKDRTVITVEAE